MTDAVVRRAHSIFTIKSVDEEARIVSGVATTPTPDRYGDVVEPKGAKFKLPLPLLWQHNSSNPVGHVVKAKVTDDGISVDAQIMKLEDPGELKGMLDQAWQYVKTGLVRGFSIGFTALESARIKDTYSLHFLEWDWLELSLVTIPANAEATIQVVRSLDMEQLALRRHGSVALGAKVLRADRLRSGAIALR